MTYRKRLGYHPRGGSSPSKQRSKNDVLPAPKRVRCGYCEKAP